MSPANEITGEELPYGRKSADTIPDETAITGPARKIQVVVSLRTVRFRRSLNTS
jgi:hypothetical protein